LGLEVSSAQVARLYRDFLDEMVIDEKDAFEADSIKSIGLKTLVIDTIMTNEEKAEKLAANVLKLLDESN
jgi:2-phospho-L-lactate transferase/gluconeogenesis factor (CofD/UPF0052 family)